MGGRPEAPAAGPPRWLTREEQEAWRAHLATSKLLAGGSTGTCTRSG